MRIWIYFLLIFASTLIGCQGEKVKEEIGNQPIEMIRAEPKFTAFDSTTILKIDKFFNRQFKNRVFNGSVLFYNDGKLFTNSYGYRNYRSKESLNDSSIFQLASGSKPYTATLILMLAQEGMISLTDSVHQILPEFPYKGITVEMLLSHRSGLSNYMYVTDSIWTNQEIAMCNDDLLASFCKLNPLPYYPVNYKFNYSNTNYFLLASIAERVTGKEFSSLISEKIFEPLEMKSTQVYSDMEFDSIPNIALGSENFRYHIPNYYLNGITGDKGVYSTTSDMLNFHLALQEETLLPDSVVMDMYEPRSKYNRKLGSYGLGWRLVKERKHYPKIIYHLGWWRGYRSYFIRIPEENIAIILLSNLARGSFLNKDELVDLIR